MQPKEPLRQNPVLFQSLVEDSPFLWSLGIGQPHRSGSKSHAGRAERRSQPAQYGREPADSARARENQTVRICASVVVPSLPSPGKGPSRTISPLWKCPRYPPETWMMLANSDNEMTQTSGADSQLVQGTMAGNGKSSTGTYRWRSHAMKPQALPVCRDRLHASATTS